MKKGDPDPKATVTKSKTGGKVTKYETKLEGKKNKGEVNYAPREIKETPPASKGGSSTSSPKRTSGSGSRSSTPPSKKPAEKKETQAPIRIRKMDSKGITIPHEVEGPSMKIRKRSFNRIPAGGKGKPKKHKPSNGKYRGQCAS